MLTKIIKPQSEWKMAKKYENCELGEFIDEEILPIAFHFVEFNKTRAFRGVGAARIQMFYDDGSDEWLWCDEKDLENNISAFGEQLAFTQAKSCYRHAEVSWKGPWIHFDGSERQKFLLNGVEYIRSEDKKSYISENRTLKYEVGSDGFPDLSKEPVEF